MVLCWGGQGVLTVPRTSGYKAFVTLRRTGGWLDVQWYRNPLFLFLKIFIIVRRMGLEIVTCEVPEQVEGKVLLPFLA